MNTHSATPAPNSGVIDLEILDSRGYIDVDYALPAYAAELDLDSVLDLEAEFTIDDPAVAWLKQQVAHGVGAYLHRAGLAGASDWGALGRFDLQEPGAYRGLANEPGACLAGMYVLRWPSEHTSGGRRDDALPGCVSFYDPRAGMNMGAIKRDPYHRYHHSMQPRPGLLSMWPAHISYFVHPNWSREVAMTVHFGVQVHARSPEAR